MSIQSIDPIWFLRKHDVLFRKTNGSMVISVFMEHWYNIYGKNNIDKIICYENDPNKPGEIYKIKFKKIPNGYYDKLSIGTKYIKVLNQRFKS